MEPAEPAGGGVGLWWGVPSALVYGESSKESVPVPRPEGRREAPEREVHACPCQSTGWQRFSPITVAGESSREVGELTLRSPFAEMRRPSAYARRCGADAQPAETTAPGVQRAQHRAPARGRGNAAPAEGSPLWSVLPALRCCPGPAAGGRLRAVHFRYPHGFMNWHQPPQAAKGHLSRFPGAAQSRRLRNRPRSAPPPAASSWADAAGPSSRPGCAPGGLWSRGSLRLPGIPGGGRCRAQTLGSCPRFALGKEAQALRGPAVSLGHIRETPIQKSVFE